MKRRELLALVVGLSLIPRDRASGQQPAKSYRIGYLGATPPQSASTDLLNLYDDFLRGLRDLGYVDGRNLTIERRFSGGQSDRYPALAEELVKLAPDLIVAPGTDAALAAKIATNTIPIITVVAGDPVGSRLVESLNRPGGNVTGTSSMAPDVTGKCLEILHEVVPRVSRVTVLSNPDTALRGTGISELEKVAMTRQLSLLIIDARNSTEVDTALTRIRTEKVDGLIVLDDATTFGNKDRICQLALELRLPMISTERLYPRAGALMSYGARFQELFREAASYVDRILKGAKPADLPMAQPTRFELVVNLNTAKAIGLTVSPQILARADEVIE
jgi:putative ABC transport system substrate-binding protein